MNDISFQPETKKSDIKVISTCRDSILSKDLTTDEKESILTITSQLVEQINNKLVYEKLVPNFFKIYKPNLKTRVESNLINRGVEISTFTDSKMYHYDDDDDKNDDGFIYHYQQRPSCEINVDEGEVVFTDIHETAKYLIKLNKEGVNTIACDFNWQGYKLAHATACYIDFSKREYNYFDVNRYFNFTHYRTRGLQKGVYLVRRRSNGEKFHVRKRKCINFDKTEIIKPMIMWTEAIMNEIYRLQNIKIVNGRYSFYKKTKHGYNARMDLPSIHDCPEGLERGVCTFYCRWMDILMNPSDISNVGMSFEEARIYMTSLSSMERKKYIKTLFDKTWDLYVSLCKD